MPAAPARKQPSHDLSHLKSVPKQQPVAVNQYKLATANQRVLAFILDALLIGMFTAAMLKVLTSMGGKADGLTGKVLNQIPMMIYFFLMHFYDGQSVGKKVMKIKVVCANGSADLSASSLLLRETVGRVIDCVGLLAGFWGAASRPDRKTWHDQLAQTIVIAHPRARASEADVNKSWMLKAAYAGLVGLVVLGFVVGFASNARAEKIVMVGDSITCGPFGERMLSNLERGGKNQVTQYCMIGSAPNHWVKGVRSGSGKSMACQTRSSATPGLKPCSTVAPKFETIIAQNPNARFVVALGTNSSVGPHADGFYEKMSAMIKIANRRCDWILPPHMTPTQSKGWPAGHVAKMESNLKTLTPEITAAVNNGKTTNCRTISSFAATAANTKGRGTTDGVHRTIEAGYYWADEIRDKLLIESTGAAAPSSLQQKHSTQAR